MLRIMEDNIICMIIRDFDSIFNIDLFFDLNLIKLIDEDVG